MSDRSLPAAPRRRPPSLTAWVDGLRAAVTQCLSQFRSNWLRTLLTLLGIVFGVGSVIAMGSIGEGAQREILAAIEDMGANATHVKAMAVEEAKIGDVINDSVGLHRTDVAALRRVLPMASAVAYRAGHEVRVTDLRVQRHELKVFGISRGFLGLHRLETAAGRGLLGVDHGQYRRVAVIGAELARRAFGGPRRAVGKRMRLDYAHFEIVGVLEARGAAAGDPDAALPIDPEQYDMAALVPIETAHEELSPPKTYNELDMISFRVGSTEQTLAAKRVIEPTLRALHGGVVDFEVIAPEEILQQRKKAQALLNIVLVSIAAISLIVGGIGVMNIMLANIMERVSEIGLRRAVGARRRDIRNQFLLEAVMICFIGGAIGVVFGLAISYGVAAVVGLPVAFAWTSVVLAFGISVAVGIIFGLMPALRAANINPIEALQHA